MAHTVFPLIEPPGVLFFKGSVEGGSIRGGGVLLEGGLFFSNLQIGRGALLFKAKIITCKVKMIRTFCYFYKFLINFI